MRPMRFLPILCPLILVSLAAVAPAAPAAQKKAASKVAVNVTTNRATAVYSLGDTVRFLVDVTENGQPVQSGAVGYVLDDEGPNRVAAGEVKLSGGPAVISGKLPKPGFLRCRVTFQPKFGKPMQAVAGAAVSPEKIEPSMPAPDDFDEFWAKQKAELAKVPMKPVLTPVPSPDEKIECFDVQVPCAGGAPVSGYFARPKGAKPGSLPAVLWVHGAGVRSSSLSAAMNGARSGMISMDINAHGLPNGKPAEFYTEMSRGRLADYPHQGNQSRDTCYFRGMYLRLVRAIDFLAAQPEWNRKELAVCGHSQGGGQALVAGGIDPRVTFIAAGVPAMCDHTGRAMERINGWPKLVPMGPDGKPDPKILQASRYFDAVNFAARAKADAIMSVGFIDGTCPPTTNYAAYNQLQGHKQILHEPKMGHAAPPHIHKAFLEAIKKHAGK